MGIQKKHGKGRLDTYYRLAKEKGYRARAAFKLIQLNKKFGFLEKSKVLIDLCAAPGSWCQVAAQTMPTDSLIIGVDLSPIKPIPKVITFQNDITTESCRNTIRQHLKTWKADTVLHDGAPNVGTAWIQDSYNQAELALEALRLATDFLVEGGVFVSKVFRSKDYNSFLYICNQLFDKVEATKPPSSRDVSAEIFVVCRGFKAPKRIDPRFLDARSVFAELTAPTPNNEAKVYNPETKKRKREGYDEGDYTQFKAVVASEFINTTDPIAILANYNQLTFDQPLNGDVALAALDRLPQTSDEIRQSCRDLKILGRKEFKHLLRWRLRVREIFGLSAKSASLAKEGSPEEEVVVESLDEELRVQEELKVLEEKESAKKKRARRRENERKQKEIVRMQMNMTAPMDIGIEQIGPTGEASMFALKGVDDKNALNNIARGKMVVMKDRPSHADFDIGIDPPVDTDNEDDDVDDDDGDRLEANLDNLYDTWKERKAEVDNKYRAKRARRENVDEEWEGLSVTDQDDSDGSMNFDDDSSDAESDITPPRRAVTDLAGDQGLSGKARAYFDQDIFQDIPGLDYLPKEASISAPGSSTAASVNTKSDNVGVSHKSQSRQNEGTFGVVGTSADADDDSDWEDEPKRSMGEHFNINVVTEEAMTLAHQLASGQKTKHDAIDDGFNKHAFRDRDGLPDWFMDDENKHDKPQKPVTKAAAAAIKEKMRALNARPIKKVREAKARKKYKMARKLEKLRKKSDMVANEEGMTEKEKADSISKMINKASKTKKREPAKLIVAKGVNRGIKGRPKGVPKGKRYKLVDSRMKKEVRAQKRLSKKK